MGYSLRLYSYEGEDVTRKVSESHLGLLVENVDHIPQLNSKIRISHVFVTDPTFAGDYLVFDVIEELRSKVNAGLVFKGQETIVNAKQIYLNPERKER